MCFFNQPSPPPAPAPPAPPPPAPAPPPAPKPLPQATQVEGTEKTRPNVQYGRKKKSSIRTKRGTDSLRIPLSNPTGGGSTGGLNIQGGNNV